MSDNLVSVVVSRVHLTSLGVCQTLESGSKHLDQLLMAFANHLLMDLLIPKNSIEGCDLTPHTIHIGYPFDDDVQTCSPA